ncbi:MAG: SpoIIE family protein phosphatase [Proteiniphilum sp.]|jgi:sigma-B regulation protein RsbU (phosphoserine phosphatase)|nr:SpoIIE family protein phosphatase [Proteiniphilum sp.]NCB24717.1 HAMP domain-containing protein [Bacteroidia bacterium]
MFRNLPFRKKVLLLLFSSIAGCVIFTTSVTVFFTEKSTQGVIDDMLFSVAYGAHNLVGDDYHDRIEDEFSISPEEFELKRSALHEFANEVKVKEVYSYIIYNNELRWTSGSLSTDTFFIAYQGDREKMKKIYFTPIEENRIVFNSYEDAYGAVRSVFVPFTTDAGTRYVVGADYDYEEVKSELTGIAIGFILFGLFILIVSFIIAFILTNKMSAPIKKLVEFSKEMVDNDYNLTEYDQNYLKEFSLKYKDEIGILSGSFLYLQNSIKHYVQDLKKTTAAKESLESQLRIANAIQMGMLPKEVDGFCDHNEFAICGFMKPAKEVGGDLYNYFMIDDEHLGFTIGDVSDKGIPAALFMSMTNTLIKSIALTGITPAEVLYRVNNELCKGNEQSMFVTLFFAKLNINTGHVEYANAGHNPFILLDKHKQAYQKLYPGIVLAAFEDVQFKNEEITLSPGDTLLMYTDGVTEAMNSQQKLFGEERLLQIFNSDVNVSVSIMVQSVIQGLDAYVEGFEQSDDITVLALRYH